MSKNITNLINLGAEIVNNPDKEKAISWLKIWGLNSPDTEALVELLCRKYKEDNKFSCKLFYWNPAEGWKVYHRLQEAAKDRQLDEETRYVASSLLHDGSPSAMGYSLRMNAYYMEQFIKIISGAL